MIIAYLFFTAEIFLNETLRDFYRDFYNRDFVLDKIYSIC